VVFGLTMWRPSPILTPCALLLALAISLVGCASVTVVRLQPDLIKTPPGTEPLAGIQTTCTGFYIATLGIPEADLDCAINDLLHKAARELGASALIGLRFEVTPDNGIWWLTKLLGVRTARASAIAVVNLDTEKDDAGTPPPLMPPRLPPPPAMAAPR